MTGARHHAVRFAALHHHDAEIQDVGNLVECVFGRHSLVFAQLIEASCELLTQIRRFGVDDADSAKLAASRLQLLFAAKDDYVAGVVRDELLGRFERAGVVALGQHDRLLVGLRSREHGFQKRHAHSFLQVHAAHSTLVRRHFLSRLYVMAYRVGCYR